MVRRQIYTGNVPAGGKCIDTYKEWALYERNTADEYVNVKLVSMEPRMFKANFYLGYNRHTRTLTKSTDAKTLLDQQAVIYAWVLVCMDKHYPKGEVKA